MLLDSMDHRPSLPRGLKSWIAPAAALVTSPSRRNAWSISISALPATWLSLTSKGLIRRARGHHGSHRAAGGEDSHPSPASMAKNGFRRPAGDHGRLRAAV